MKSKAAVLYEPGRPMVIEEIEVADPKQGEVMVRVVGAGVCHSDLHVASGALPKPMPIVLGHEGAGVVERVGPGVTGLEPGDHVVFNIAPQCNRCHYCNNGLPHLCLGYGQMAATGTMMDGTTRMRTASGQPIHHWTCVSCFSEYVVVPEFGAVKVRQDVPLDTAALVGCAVLTGIGATRRTAKVRASESVAVFGCGGVGLNAIQGAKLAGAYPLIAVDISEEKLALARRFGATHTVNGRELDPVAAIRSITTYGADWAFEVIGREQTIQQAFQAVGPRGTVVVVGMGPLGSTVALPILDFVAEKSIKGCFYGSARVQTDIPQLLDWAVTGRIDLEGLVSRRMKLEEINEAFDLLRQGDGVRTLIALG
ncbi:MAG: zinc-binding dehydrogenase [Bacillota bacterium]